MLEVLPLSDVGRLPPGTGLAEVAPAVTLADQIIASAQAAGEQQPWGVVDFLIDELDCELLLDRVPGPMSRGELQICSLLIMLSARPTALSLADPTAGLDARKSRVVADFLVDLAQSQPVTVATDAPAFAR